LELLEEAVSELPNRRAIMKRGNSERIIFGRLNYPETRLVKNSVEFLGIGCVERVIPTKLLTD
jgi:hypothetical protein